MRVRIKVRDILLKAELFDNLKTTKAVAESLPIKGIVKRWGDEIYFETPLTIDFEENSKEVVDVRDIAYWIPGRAICIFFGKTPISDDKIRPAGPVNVFGKVFGDLKKLKEVREGDEIEIM